MTSVLKPSTGNPSTDLCEAYTPEYSDVTEQCFDDVVSAEFAEQSAVYSEEDKLCYQSPDDKYQADLTRQKFKKYINQLVRDSYKYEKLVPRQEQDGPVMMAGAGPSVLVQGFFTFL